MHPHARQIPPQQPMSEDARHRELMQALYKIVEAIQGLKLEVGLIKHTIQAQNKP